MEKTIKVKELINELKKLSPEASIYLSSDSEGNGFSTIDKNFSIIGDDKKIILYPHYEGIDYYDIFPELKEEEENLIKTINN